MFPDDGVFIERRAANRGPLHALSTRQRVVLTFIERYVEATGEACPASVIARKLDLHHSTVQDHLRALFQKGWLRTPNAPAMPHREVA